ncbi:methylated-DNA--[protein]-cysteine S-methyltransferase [[Mycoplasma] anseris]|uniref:DNA-3-methyladenine glycosylase II n=1 Tax=[Mycoplasma] anseris TaxID=92400 RepID=A0A2Z4NCF4_9BACT|nr:methylated-DNA--[protein]-cysteine S-methyltransferase [[Mycoplasma] anseris]AWX69240.1 methylated-DNA--[protein]-cysteine S-methyltransferase [[Mycoplasma] anseris]
MIFKYDESALEFLKNVDEKLQKIINKFGKLEISLEEDVFQSIIKNIIGQQISIQIQNKLWNNIKQTLKEINLETTKNLNLEDWKNFGLSSQKAQYIFEFITKIRRHEFDIDKLNNMSDDEAISYLTTLNGIGPWTAEMVLVFCLNRLDVFSINDLGIKIGLMNLYGLKEITKKQLNDFKKKFSPYGSIASFYIWKCVEKDIWKPKGIWQLDKYFDFYQSKIGVILLQANEDELTKISINPDQKYKKINFLEKHHFPFINNDSKIIKETKTWLDNYFNNKISVCNVPLKMQGTPFQKEVWLQISQIQYGKTKTYKEIANQLAIKKGIKNMSCQAVGTACGKNNFPIIIPCHRVLASNSIGGFNGNIKTKINLLNHEKVKKNS